MAQTPETNERNWTALGAQLQSPVAAERLSALAVLLRGGPEAAPATEAVAACLTHPDHAEREVAVVALGQIGAPAAVASLAGALSAEQPKTVRIFAANGLARAGTEAAPAIEQLSACLMSEDDELRWHASFALGRIGAAAVPALREALVAPGSQTRTLCAAADALGWIGPPAQEALSDLRQLEASDSAEARLAALAAQAKISDDATAHRAALQAMLTVEDAEVRRAAVERIGDLGKIGHPFAISLLQSAADQAGPVRAAAALALVKIEANEPRTVVALTKLLHDREAEVRAAALMALAKLGPLAAEALPALRALGQDKEPRVAAIASAATQSIEASG